MVNAIISLHYSILHLKSGIYPCAERLKFPQAEQTWRRPHTCITYTLLKLSVLGHKLIYLVRTAGITCLNFATSMISSLILVYYELVSTKIKKKKERKKIENLLKLEDDY